MPLLQVSAMRLPVAMQQAPQAAAAAHQMRACAREASPGTPAQQLFARSAGGQPHDHLDGHGPHYLQHHVLQLIQSERLGREISLQT